MKWKLCKIIFWINLTQNQLTIYRYAVNINSSETTRNGKLSHVVQIDVRRFP